MFHSQIYSQKLFELRQFLNKLTFKIIDSQRGSKNKKLLMTNGLMGAYSIVHELCNMKPSLQQKMLTQFQSCLTAFIEEYIRNRPIRGTNNNKNQFLDNSEEVISWYNQLWQKFKWFLREISKKVFVYLDKYFLPSMESKSLYKVGIKIFEKNVCNQRNLSFFQDCYFKELREIREKRMIQSQQLLLFSQSLVILNSEFINKLTERYICESSQFYLNQFIKNNQLPYFQYLSKIYNLYLFEETLLQKSICMNILQHLALFTQFKRRLVQNYTSIFIQHGFKPMFRKKNIDAMKIVLLLYKRFEGLQKIRQAYYDFLIEEGDKIIQRYIELDQSKNSSEPQRKFSQEKLNLIDILYQFYKCHISLLSQGFQKDNELLVTLNNAIQKIIAKIDNFTLILEQYCQVCKLMNTFHFNKQKITILFEKISSKDQFIGIYETQLFKKIKNKQININDEQIFVNYLNEMCGNQLTFRLLKKLKDFKEMEILNQQLKVFKNIPRQTKFDLTILSLQQWEKMFTDQVTLNLTLPQMMSMKWLQIQTAFIEKDTKKKLIPLPFESSLILSVYFNSHKIDIKCHLIQAAVFTYIGSRSYTSQQELIMNLRLQKNILQSTIETFETVPGLLLKTSLGDYILNWNWLPSLQLKETNFIDFIVKSPETTKQITKNVKQDREILVQAAIVKFMKKKKSSTFEEIAIEITKMIRLFKPIPSLIKTTVQKLIKKDFIQETQNGLLSYVE